MRKGFNYDLTMFGGGAWSYVHIYFSPSSALDSHFKSSFLERSFSSH